MDYWHKQTTDKPLFEDLLWGRPENKRHAGKLLIIGGNLHGFAAVGEAYAETSKAGIGTARVLLPQALQKTVGPVLENAEFAPSNASGSFSQQALSEWVAHSGWADGVLVAGDLGRNSETAIVLERFIDSYRGQLTLTKDAPDYFASGILSQKIASRADTTLALSFALLQKLFTHVGFAPITFAMPMQKLIETLHEFTLKYPVSIVTLKNETIYAACQGQVSTTQTKTEEEIWRVRTAAHTATWQLQNPTNTFKALTTAVIFE